MTLSRTATALFTTPLTALMLLLGLSHSSGAGADSVRVAVAANFTAAAKALAADFKAQSGHQALLAFGSTGKLYTQIANGAPFELFLAADQVRPRRAIDEGLAVAGTQATYASGQLALFSHDPALVDAEGAVLKQPERYRRLAIANPRLAPYGSAAVEVLKNLGVYESAQGKLVMGENIAQTYQFAFTGNAELGLVALAQVNATEQGSYWPVPQALYSPIHQDAVLLTRGQGNPAATALLAYLQSDAARAIIRQHGYQPPEPGAKY